MNIYVHVCKDLLIEKGSTIDCSSSYSLFEFLKAVDVILILT